MDSLLEGCNELESRLSQRVAELERMKDVHVQYREKMSRHRQLVETSDRSLAIDQLNDRIRQLTTDR